MNKNLLAYVTDPTVILRDAANLLTRSGAPEIVDVSNPFTALLAASASMVSNLNNRQDIVERRRHPSLATNMEELYPHMTDVDYIDRFSTPGRITLNVMFPKSEIYRLAVTTPLGDMRKLIIPDNTAITMDDLVFTTLYPIELRILPHGGLQTVYQTDVKHPLQNLETNLVDWYTRRLQEVQGDYIQLEFPVLQLQQTVYTESISLTTGFKSSYSYSDQYHYCRVWGVDSAGNRVEYATTHDALVLDSNNVTIQLKVLPGVLELVVPVIYLNKGILLSNLRIEIYTTKGAVVRDLSLITGNNYTWVWGVPNNAANSVYSSPLNVISSALMYSTSVLNNGSNGISFSELRERIITGKNADDVPITDVHLRTTLTDRGYQVTKSIDDLMRRVYLATRKLPKPVTTANEVTFNSGVGCALETMYYSIESLLGSRHVNDHAKRITILPSAVYKQISGGRVILLSDETLDEMAQWPTDELLTDINTNQYLYSPFCYVLDTNDKVFSVRAYLIDDFKIRSRSFIEANDTTGLNVSTKQIEFVKTTAGYTIRILTSSSQAYKDIPLINKFAQLSFVPPNENKRTYINAIFVGLNDDDEHVLEFNLDTTWDFDVDHLMLNNFQMFQDETRPFASKLIQEMDIVYGVDSVKPVTWQRGAMDGILGFHKLTDKSYGITRESITLDFATRLTNLWGNSGTIAGTASYATYGRDILDVYERDVLDIDPATGAAKFTIVNGQLEFVKLHRKGDPKLDGNGVQRIKHYASDFVLDDNNLPIEIAPRKSERYWDMLFIDGVYAFSTHPADLNYKKTIGTTLVGYLTGDLDLIVKRLLQGTELYFYPTKTLGNANVVVGSRQNTTLDMNMAFKLTYYVDRRTNSDTKLKEQLLDITSATINELLNRRVISTSAIIDKLMDALGDAVISIKLNKFGTSGDIDVFTITDETASASVKRILTLEPNNLLRVRENIVVDFELHRD